MAKQIENKTARPERDRLELARRQWEGKLGQTLEQLDGERWGSPSYDSHLVRTCHALRKKAIGTLTDEEVRMAIGQQMGLEWLVPLAIQRLRENVLRSGDFYEGDLLVYVLRVPADYWSLHHTEAQAISAILETLKSDNRWPDAMSEVRHAVATFLYS